MSTAVARATDPETSHAAAASVTDLREKQFCVLKVLRGRPARGYTDEELVWDYRDRMTRRIQPLPPQSASGIRTRRSELVRLGFVEDSGDRRLLESGRYARVWRVTKK